jgi:arylformamidase
MLLDGKRVVDLTRPLEPGKERFKLSVRTFSVGDILPDFSVPAGEWYVLQEWEISSHLGTHVESPLHHVRGGMDIAHLPLDCVMGEAVVLDFRQKGPGEAIDVAELSSAGRDVAVGDIVLIHTGFDRLYNQLGYDRPFLSLDAIRWLIQHKVSCIGIDASGIERYGAPEQPGHVLLFQNGIPVVEELTKLDELHHRRVFFMALPLPVTGGDASPVRAIAVEEED